MGGGLKYFSVRSILQGRADILEDTIPRNWTDETALFCEILVDPMNVFLQTLESKAREVFASILQGLNETEEGFAIKNSSNFNEKKPFKDLDLDVKKLQSKYNNIKTN